MEYSSEEQKYTRCIDYIDHPFVRHGWGEAQSEQSTGTDGNVKEMAVLNYDIEGAIKYKSASLVCYASDDLSDDEFSEESSFETQLMISEKSSEISISELDTDVSKGLEADEEATSEDPDQKNRLKKPTFPKKFYAIFSHIEIPDVFNNPHRSKSTRGSKPRPKKRFSDIAEVRETKRRRIDPIKIKLIKPEASTSRIATISPRTPKQIPSSTDSYLFLEMEAPQLSVRVISKLNRLFPGSRLGTSSIESQRTLQYQWDTDTFWKQSNMDQRKII